MNCTQSEAPYNEFHQLINQEKELLCLLESMKDSINNDWAQINILLNEQVPEDMPAEEKNNMLKVRNADLIRMFESYQSMSDDIKEKLTETEKRDQEMGAQIINLKKELKRIESERMIFFEKSVEESDEKTLNELRALRKKTLNADCH
ncbi:hypothetical protein GCM10007940_20840 [Portibacter lacus]|uniref:Uncharacterized protein n=2 Tax=Portibacter lacus TaxID=1099794 RepID=A0AA37SQF3_9BACT|nr:hypothetical protein GCM10007940_20840 [Portibacter lacus]